jgi:methyl-accepting chemotaxis protein
MNIKQRIWVPPALAIAVFTIGISISYYFSVQTSAALTRIGAVDYPALALLDQMINTLSGIQDNLKTAVTTADKALVENAATKAKEFRRAGSELAHVSGFSGTAGQLESAFSAYYASAVDAAEIMIGARSGDPHLPMQRMQSALGELQSTLKAARSASEMALTQGLSLSNTNVKTGLVVMLAMATIIIIGLTLISYRIIGSITRSLEGILERVRDIACGEPDLSKTVDISTPDEFGEVARCINLFIGNLRDLVAKVSAISIQVRNASDRLRTEHDSLSRDGAAQNESAARIANAIEVQLDTIKRIASHAATAADSAANTTQVARGGSSVIEGTIQNIHRISASVDETTDKVAFLRESSTRIGSVIGVVKEIADQTNLLALNAAIEAARAGAQGRGFAVVADEVRKLAERTSVATGEIGTIVEGIQTGIGSAVSSIGRGKAAAVQGKADAVKAQESLGQILESIDRVGELIREIAASTDQQVLEVRAMEHQSGQVVSVAERTLVRAHGVTRQSDELAAATAELGSLMGAFKL